MSDSAADAQRLHPALVHHIVNSLGWPSLRPLQEAAVEPVRARRDALLLALTAGGKTEAAVFPLLSAMLDERWSGLSVAYVTPLRALINNLEPRLAAYAGWLGRRAQAWHGDTRPSARQRMLREPPDLLITTPESLEAMLVSRRTDPPALFADLRAVVVDEVHAFAGDDRGWHLLAVLARLERLAGRPVQRVGLSATVGNPAELLRWLQAGHPEPGVVVQPPAAAGEPAQVSVDHVGSVGNAATVIAALHRGEKRLVFADSRRRVEELGLALRGRGVTAYVSHSSLSLDERRRAEQAFAEGRDCVIVATSTLELGIDVGDLDRVIQLDAPTTVASFLQRLGRTGRRPGAPRNTLFLTLDVDGLLRTLGLLSLWRRGFVEPVVPPPRPLHIAAQQVLALVLQEGRIGQAELADRWAGLPFADHLAEITAHLRSAHFLEADDGMLFLGGQAERAFGYRHFMELTSAFTADPEVVVVAGRSEIGTVHPLTLTARLPAGQPRLLLLAGRSWRVTHVDWTRRRCFVAAADGGGRSRWEGAPRPLGYAMCQAMRAVVLGEAPGVELSRRASAAVPDMRQAYLPTVSPAGPALRLVDGKPEWWTWAGARANATLLASLGDPLVPGQQPHNLRLRVDPAGGAAALAEAIRTARRDGLRKPPVDAQALAGLKFSAALPAGLAESVLAQRAGDSAGAGAVLSLPSPRIPGRDRVG